MPSTGSLLLGLAILSGLGLPSHSLDSPDSVSDGLSERSSLLVIDGLRDGVKDATSARISTPANSPKELFKGPEMVDLTTNKQVDAITICGHEV